MANLLIPCANIFTLNLDAPHQASISFQFFKTSACNIDEEQKKGLHFTPSDSGAPRIWQWGATTRGLGVKPPAAYGFLRFSYNKNTHFSTLFLSKKGVQWVSAATTDNAKIFSQLMSKSTSLTKISERRLQPLLVWEIIDWKLGFSTLLQSQRRGMAPWLPCVRLCPQTSCFPLTMSVVSKK